MTGGLKVRDLSVRYGKHEVLTGIHIPEILPGRVVGLLGRNAAGKSTLLKSLAGMAAYSGRLAYGDLDLDKLDSTQRARLVGYLPQVPIQASGLLVWEIAIGTLRTTQPDLPPHEVDERLTRVLQRFDLLEYAFQPVEVLSGGKRQLLGLALIVARETRLLLLDEPTSALDLRWQLEALDIIKASAHQGKTTSIVAIHDINLALRFCDDIILLADGKVAAAGNTSEVLTPEIIRSVYGVEARVERCSKNLPIFIVDHTENNRSFKENEKNG